MIAFDVTAELPGGPTLLEASAGTGKTWTISALAARYIAEFDIPIEKLLIITFSNAAADELRSRVFSRLVSLAAQTQALISGQQPDTGTDPVAIHLAAMPRPHRFVERLQRAHADFGRATIATIHSFCQAQLSQLGILGDWNGEDQVVADMSTLIEDTVHDEYLARFLHDRFPPADIKRSLRLATAAANTSLPLRGNRPEILDYIHGVRERFHDRREALGVVSFDDLPGRLDRLTQHSPQACQALRDRFPVVLVDEFQDTDPAQWAILKRVFVTPGEIIILIGDPKQSIYGFRSADLACYSEAKQLICQQATLVTNYRSEPGVTAGVAELFGNVELGWDTQLYPVATSYPEHSPTLRFSFPISARLWLRTVPEAAGNGSDQLICDDVVTCVTTLLNTGSIHQLGQEHPVTPSDIAILTRTRDRGLALVAALRAAGIPASWQQPTSCLESPALEQWCSVLAAIAEPTRDRVMAAAFGDLLGVAATDVLAKDEEAAASQRVHQLAHRYAVGGLEAVIVELLAGLATHLNDTTDGPKRYEELIQLGEYLLSIEAADPEQAIAALRRAVDLPPGPRPPTNAVHVSTMHSAKGLEFPIVLLPQVSVTDLNLNSPIVYVEESGQRVLYVGDRPGYRDKVTQQARAQARQEELRLLYVGLTRAKHLSVAWHAMSRRAAAGPLTALLARDRHNPQLAPEYRQLPHRLPFDPQLVHISPATGRPTELIRRQESQPRQLRLASFDRGIDTAWRRTSYSGLTLGLHDSAPDEPEVEWMEDHLEANATLASPMNGLPGGTRFGTLVHEILEAVDWTRPGHLDEIVAARAAIFGLDSTLTAQLTAAMHGVLTTPLGGLDESSLSDIPISSRLPELDFDLPLGGVSRATVADLAAAMAAHLPHTDPLVNYPQRLAATEAAATTLAGFLTGSIDAVFQVQRGFIVVDYKTNRLPTGPDQELSVGHYTPAAMAEAMMQAHYPLQALLYCAALHRYLGWRLPSYDPLRHLGGVGYLFVRGMAGPETPVIGGGRCGVFEWYPPAELIVEVSSILAGHHG